MLQLLLPEAFAPAAEPAPTPTPPSTSSDSELPVISELECTSTPLATTGEGTGEQVQMSEQVKPEVVGATWGSFRDVTVCEMDGASYAFAIAGSRLLVFGLADPDSPEVIRELQLPTVASRLVVSDNYVYIAAGSRLVIVDARSPTHAKIVSQAQIEGLTASSIVVSGGYALVSGHEGVLAVDIQQPATPKPVSYLREPALDIFLFGRYGFLASGYSGLTVVDFSDVCAPQVVGRLGSEGYARRVSVVDGYALVADSVQGLLVIDARDPTRMNTVLAVPTPLRADGIFVSGTTAFVTGESALWLFDVAEPERPTLHGRLRGDPTLTLGGEVYVQGDHAFVAGWSDLVVVDVQLRLEPRVVAVTPTTVSLSTCLSVLEEYAFVITKRGLTVIDITEPAQPETATEFRMGHSQDLKVSRKGYAFVLRTGNTPAELVVVDVTDPPHPRLVSQVDTGIRYGGLFVSGDYAYIAGSKQDSGLGQLIIVNIEDALSPHLVGELELPFAPRKVFVSDGHIFVTRGPDNNNTGLTVIDAREPRSPRIVSTIETTYYRTDVFVEDGYAYVSYNGLTVYDVSEPSQPRVVSELALPGTTPENVIIFEGKAFMASRDKLWVIDVGDPASPRVVEELEMVGSEPRGIHVTQTYVYVADQAGGLLIYPSP